MALRVERAWTLVLTWLISQTSVLWLLFALDGLRNAQHAPDPLEAQLHLVRLALLASVFAGLPWALARTLSQHPKPAARAAALCVVAAAAAPVAWQVADSLAEGEGLVALGIDASLLRAAMFALLSGFGLFVYVLSLPERRHFVHGLTLLSCAALAMTSARAAHTYAAAAGAALLFCSLGATSLLANALTLRPGLAMSVRVIGGSLIAITLGWGALHSSQLARARRAVLLQQPVALAFDLPVFGADEAALRAVRFSITALSPADCAPRQASALPPPLVFDASRRRNVLLVSVDALRRDVIGTRVADKAVAPNLARMYESGQGSEQAYTTYAATFFAVGGALTGLVPSRMLLAPEPPRTLFSMLDGRVDQRLIVLPTSGYFRRPAFERFVLQNLPSKSPGGARAQTDTLIEFVHEARKRQHTYAAWVHYYEPHAPYESTDHAFGDDERGRYLGEVALVDRQIGRLFAALAREGALADTLVIVFADHGEALGERGYWGHHTFLNRFIAEIPMVMHVPFSQPVQRTTPAQITDIAPTVLHFFGVTAPHAMSGQSRLGPEQNPGRSVVSEAFATGGPRLSQQTNEPITSVQELEARIERARPRVGRYAPTVSLTKGRHRLIVSRATGLTALYDWKRDPEEQRDLSLEQPALTQKLVGELDTWHREQSRLLYCTALEIEQQAHKRVN